MVIKLIIALIIISSAAFLISSLAKVISDPKSSPWGPIMKIAFITITICAILLLFRSYITAAVMFVYSVSALVKGWIARS